MAYALGFTKDVTDLISDMRDWRWEMVRDGGKTPSAGCFSPGLVASWNMPQYTAVFDNHQGRWLFGSIEFGTDVALDESRMTKTTDLWFQCEPCGDS